VVLAAEGRGFNAGVDIKEIQARGPRRAARRQPRLRRAFAAVYECEVPVIAAVHGFCLGGGIGLVGNADVIVASEDATFGLPELDRGALGAATHLARLVPQHLMRAPVLHLAHGDRGRAARARLGVAGRAARRTAAPPPWSWPAEIAAKDGELIRLGPRSDQRHRPRRRQAAATASSRASPSRRTSGGVADRVRHVRKGREGGGTE
jgi:enoyl-CoA hydratase